MKKETKTKVLASWLPPGGSNLFQSIKALCAERESKGKKTWKLTIGQPTGPALWSAREACAKAVLSGSESMHEYQDNGSPGVPGFARDFVQLHLPDRDLAKFEAKGQIAYLPLPGIKPALGMVISACGARFFSPSEYVATMTDPGYPTPVDQCRYLGVSNYSLPTNPENNFQFSPDDIKPGTKLVMVNYPHNPSGQGADRNFWRKLCRYCFPRGIRVFNDAAYAILAHNKEFATLSEVAVDFPKLSWVEAFSASKVIGNGTGWRIGAMVGSADFIADTATVKGNSDSGFFAPAAVGVLDCMRSDMDSIIANRRQYSGRIRLLSAILVSRGMKPAVEPGAGFFTLWKAPSRIFGHDIENGEAFNRLMIDKTGIAGVHFSRYIRYAVTSPVENPEFIKALKKGFGEAKVGY